MELAILGAVGLLGYTVSDREPRSVPREQVVPRHAQAYPWGPGTEVQRLLEADRSETQARWEQSIQPHVTGVITPNTKPASGQQPFFRSAKSQNTNNNIKQRRMEMFTGTQDFKYSQTGTYRKKQEVTQMFKPEWTAGAVRSSGSAGTTPLGIDQGARYIPSQKQNNVLPTQQVRVGPGLGIGLDVPASDGFHPMLRVMPKNVNEHRLNNLPGGVVSGSSGVAMRSSDVQLAQFGPPRYWAQERRPTAATKAAVDAASERPAQLLQPCGGRIVGDDYWGHAGHTGSYLGGGTRPTRDRDDNNLSVHETNVTGARHGVGAFAKATHDRTRFDAQGREQTQTYEGMLTGSTGPKANELYLLPQTNRSIHTTDVAGNPGSTVEGGKARPQDAMDRTLRELTHPQSQPGIASPYIKGHSVQATGKYLDRESKRYGQHMVGYMPSPHMAVDVRVPGIVQLRPRLQPPVVTALPTTTTPAAMAPLGQSTSTYNKLPSANMHVDLNVAKTQLANNPLHTSLT